MLFFFKLIYGLWLILFFILQPEIEVNTDGSDARNVQLIVGACVGAFLFAVLLVVAVTIIAIVIKYCKGEI